MHREQAWNTREPHSEHFQWFQNLLDLHQLTREWMKALDPSGPKHLLPRVEASGVRENLAILDELSEKSMPADLQNILDAAYPEELLERLEQTVWVVQAWSLRRLLERTTKKERPSLENSLQQTSWKAGKSCGQKRWPLFPESAKHDLRRILQATQDSPIAGFPRSRPFLIQRALREELCVEMLHCAHTVPHVEMHPVAGLMTLLHTDWLRGFVYTLNPRVMIDFQPGDFTTDPPRFPKLRWHFHQSPETTH